MNYEWIELKWKLLNTSSDNCALQLQVIRQDFADFNIICGEKIKNTGYFIGGIYASDYPEINIFNKTINVYLRGLNHTQKISRVSKPMSKTLAFSLISIVDKTLREVKLPESTRRVVEFDEMLIFA